MRASLARGRRQLVAGYVLAIVGTAASWSSPSCRPATTSTRSPRASRFLALVVADAWRWAGLARASSAARARVVLVFNYFFLPPYDTFAIAEAQDVIVLFVVPGALGA